MDDNRRGRFPAENRALPLALQRNMVLQRVAMNVPVTVEDRVPPSSLPRPPALDCAPPTALFLDFDGTLVDLAPHPDEITGTAALPGLLGTLAERLGGRLAVVSGRALADIEKHLGKLDLAMAGSHGGEIRTAGFGGVDSLAPPLPAGIAARLKELAAEHGGLLVETKPTSAAIHYRGKPEIEQEVIARASEIAREAGVQVKRGKMVVELAMPGADKGAAVAHFMALPEFADARPVFVGDDVTDEDAFRAVLDHGGYGVLVGPGRETAARYRLPDVAAVHDWLEGALR